MEPIAVGLATVFQLLGIAMFFDQPKDYCSPAPSLASWIFLGATLCFLWDADIYPCRFRYISVFWQLLIEIVAAIFLVELSTIIVWCGLERFLFSMLEALFNGSESQRCVPFALVSWVKRLVSAEPSCKLPPHLYWLSGLITSLASLTALWYVLEVTDGMWYLKRIVRDFFRNLGLTWQMIRCYLAMNMAGRRRTLQVCRLAANRKRRTRSCCPKKEEDDDDDTDSDIDSDCDSE